MRTAFQKESPKLGKFLAKDVSKKFGSEDESHDPHGGLAEAIRQKINPGHSGRPGEDLETGSRVVDHQSLPIQERIRYYESKIRMLSNLDSFRDEVLYEVYRQLLDQSLQQATQRGEV